MIPASGPQRIKQRLQDWAKSGTIPSAEIFLVLTLLVIGSLIIFLTPPGAGLDEDQHLIRVWQMSDLVLIPRQMAARVLQYPKIFMDLSYRRQLLVEPAGLDFWQKYAGMDLYAEGYHYGPLRTRSVYSPPLLLPQAIAMRFLGRNLDLPALTVYYGSRLAGLLSYILLVWLAFRKMPYRKWTFLAVALMPMAVHQAAILSADSISNGIGFIFIAGCLAVESRNEAGWREWGLLVLLIFLLFLAKINLVPLVLLPFLIIQPSRYKNKAAYWLLVLAAAVLFIVEVMGWNRRVSSSLEFIGVDSSDPARQLNYILSLPLVFASTLLTDFIVQGRTYFAQAVGEYGYGYGAVPAVVYLLVLGSVGLALLAERGDPQPPNPVRRALLALFILCYVATVSSLYLTATPVGLNEVIGMHGRYFIPLIPLLVLGVPEIKFWQRVNIKVVLIAICSTAALAAFVIGMFMTYHVTCGTSYYTRGGCLQPLYKNFAPWSLSSIPISDGDSLVQEIIPVCNGLTSFQVWINAIEPAGAGRTQFILHDSLQDIDLLDQTIENTRLPVNDWYRLAFDPNWDSAGRLYILTVRGVDGEAGQGIRLGYSEALTYPRGVLRENGIAADEDIFFQYGCITGLEKLLQTGSP